MAQCTYEPAAFLESFNQLRAKVASEHAGVQVVSPSTKSAASKDMVVVAVQLTMMQCGEAQDYLHQAIEAVETAVSKYGATLVLLPELFMGPYFCQSQEGILLGLAEEVDNSPFIATFQELAMRLEVVLPISIYERKNHALYNSVVMIDATGEILGIYRKSHIPDGTGYQEKFYFTPGDTGFKVFHTKVGCIGIAICWDQWFPEAARAMALLGADILLYPTAIGSEPQDETLHSRRQWQRVMQGHAAANMVPVVASNRVGTEVLLRGDGSERQRITFYGHTFITDNTGDIIGEVTDGADMIVAVIDKQANLAARLSWGVFRDRRPELYGILQSKDGSQLFR